MAVMAQYAVAGQHRFKNGEYVVVLAAGQDHLAAVAQSKKACTLICHVQASPGLLRPSVDAGASPHAAVAGRSHGPRGFLLKALRAHSA